MPTIPNARGELVDLSTGEVVGRQEGAPAAAPTTMRAAGPAPMDISKPFGDQVLSLAKQLSWGMGSALFSLPDAATRTVGRGLGVKEESIPQFAKIWNRGEVAPENAPERYARAIGEGVGAALPFTGVLAAVARAKPLLQATSGSAGVMQGIANDTLRFIQQSPGKAAALDIAFGAGYEGLKQVIEEQVDDSNPHKALYKEAFPMAALVGGPLAAAKVLEFSPTGRAVGAVSDKLRGLNANMGEVEKDVLEGIQPSFFRLPVLNVLPKVILKRAETKLAESLGPIAESREAQEALIQLEKALMDPEIAKLGFEFGASERTLDPALLAKQAEIMKGMSRGDLTAYREQRNRNWTRMESLFDSFSPATKTTMTQSFNDAMNLRKQMFDGLVQQKEMLTAGELASISERLGPQNMDMLNDEIRGAMMSRMEMSYKTRQDILQKLGVDGYTTPDGVPINTRDPETGRSYLPATEIDRAARALIDKYSLKGRWTLGEQEKTLPEPIRMLRDFYASQKDRQDKAVKSAIGDLIDNDVLEQFRGTGYYKFLSQPVTMEGRSPVRSVKDAGIRKAPENSLQKMENELRRFIDIAVQEARVPGKLSPKQQSIYDDRLKGNASVDKDGTFTIGFGDLGTRYDKATGKKVTDQLSFNPKRIATDAQTMGEQAIKVDMNAPEAMDLLQAALRARNTGLVQYNKALKDGRMRLTDAQRLLERGTAVYNDIENLVTGHVPALSQNFEQIRPILQSYKQEFERSLPLLVAQRGPSGEYMLPNEKLLQNAFKNAENLRQLTAAMGESPETDVLLNNGMIDWLRSKNVLDKDGLVDPKKIRQVIDNNRNIVEALPASLQGKLAREADMADDFVRRMGELKDRETLAKDNELDTLLAKATRPEALPQDTLFKALADPATMATLVRGLEKNPEMVTALKRAVFELAREGTTKGGALASFITNNKPALEVLFKNDMRHLENLKTMADLQRRVEAFSDITGQVPPFESTDASLRRIFGTGIQFLTTTMRETMVGRISPQTGALALMLRLASGLENQIYNKLFIRALEDKTFAERITHLSTPEEGKQMLAMLEKSGVPARNILKPVLQASVAGAVAPDQEAPAPTTPVVPRETARQMLRALPPAPPTTYNLRAPAPQQPQNPGDNVQLMYPQLFPNDPISGMLLQRQRQIQGQNQPPQPAR